MSKSHATTLSRQSLRFAAIALFMISAGVVYSQTTAPTNSLPDPYRSVENWARMPQGRTWGSTAGVWIDPDGASVWVAERCGANSCLGSNLDPVLKFDASGKLMKSFGAGMFVFPHGISVDRDGNVWVTDGQGKDGKGHQVFKFSPDGKVLLALGKAGIAGDGPDTFNAPSSVLVAPSGDIFVGDGHGGNTNARVIKFDKDGKFIKTWGKKGSGPGEFDTPHALAMDSRGRLFVGDRNNNRIQIFDPNGNYIDQWGQFSRPSGIYIDSNDIIYVADSESESVSKNHDGWKRGIRVGKASDGSLIALIPDPVEKATGSSAAEGVAADTMGNIYGAEVGPKRLMKYVRN
jgi:DNA-binding beta-propeller fold protein YncE